MHIYLREAPRALILVGSEHFAGRQGGRADFALVISAVSSERSRSGSRVSRNGSTPKSTAAKVEAELVDVEELSISSLRRLTQTQAAGCLGIMNIGTGRESVAAG